jgi:hypothetical protein
MSSVFTALSGLRIEPPGSITPPQVPVCASTNMVGSSTRCDRQARLPYSKRRGVIQTTGCFPM